MPDEAVNYVQPVIDRIDRACPGLPPDLLRLYALLAFVKGNDTTLVDVHDAWAIWRDQTAPQHKSLIPFDRLSADVQELDRPYRDAIGTVALGLVSSPDGESA